MLTITRSLMNTAVLLGAIAGTLQSQQPGFNLKGAVSDPTTVVLSWTGPANAIRYYVQRAVGGAGFANLGTPKITGTTYTDVGAPAGTAVRYRVIAKFNTGPNRYSNAISLTTGTPGNVASSVPAPSAPAPPPGQPVMMAQGAKQGAELASDKPISELTAQPGTAPAQAPQRERGLPDRSRPLTVAEPGAATLTRMDDAMPPSAADPANFAARVGPDNSVTLTWDPVPGVSWYLLGGPGMGLYGQRAQGTSYTVRGVGSGTLEWTVASLAGKEQPPLTNGAKWPKAAARISVVGFADTHTHPFANLAAGGKLFWGAAFGPIPAALTICNSAHGFGGLSDAIGNIKRTVGGHVSIGHKTGGFPHFDGWPSWSTLNHQQMHADWIHRAYQGGLRLLVAHAVNNALLCELARPASGRTCEDMEAVDLQIAAAKAMEHDIDMQSGGPKRGWFRIAYTPKQAREIIDSGKLAVVLGIEVDKLFRCGMNECDPSTVDRELTRYYDKGVRHIIPVHFVDNAFGGYALGGGTEKYLFGANSMAASQGGLLTGTAPKEEDCSSRFAQKCNQRGLTPLGDHLIRSMMNKGMIIDIDHMGMHTTDAVLALTSARQYPVVGGHTGFVGVAPAGKSSERDKSDAWLAAMRRDGGMVSVGVTGGETRSHTPSWRGPVANNCPKTAKAVAQGYLYAVDRMGGPDNAAVGLATDQFLHDFTGPRFDGHCPGESNSTRVSYPLATRTGLTLGPSKAGNRDFDYNTEGLAHFGLLPELIQDLKNVGLTDRDLDPLFRSAEGYIRSWERAVASIPVP